VIIYRASYTELKLKSSHRVVNQCEESPNMVIRKLTVLNRNALYYDYDILRMLFRI
jgi:hypothetical protein